MKKNWLFIVLLLGLAGCNRVWTSGPVQNDLLVVNEDVSVSEEVNAIVAPYQKEMNRIMGEVIGESSMLLDLKQPESLLSNFLADMMLEVGNEVDGGTIDCSVLNYGGIRLPEIPKGDITKGLVYELLPFDNFITVLDLDQATMQSFLNHVAVKGGWPVSSSLRFELDTVKGVAKNIRINNQALSSFDKIRVAMPDYIANGGDNCAMLKGIEQNNTGLFMRDGLIEYLENRDSSIGSTLDGRISYAQ